MITVQLFAVGAGNNFLRCTDAEGGRERPGKACLGPAGRAKGVLICAGLRLVEQCEHAAGRLKRPACGRACEPSFSRRGAVCGRVVAAPATASRG